MIALSNDEKHSSLWIKLTDMMKTRIACLHLQLEKNIEPDVARGQIKELRMMLRANQESPPPLR